MVDGPIVHEGLSAKYRLESMGLDLDKMLEVVRRGESARADATLNDPDNAAMIDAYRYRVRALRDLFGPEHWRRFKENGLELLVKADGQTAVMTKGGDEAVGLASGHPQPKSEIGDGAAATITGTLPLFGVEWLQAQDQVRPEAREIWMLLVHATPATVRAELSLGSELSERGRVARWFERIILPELDPNDLGPKGARVFDEPEEGALDVPVIRKKPA